MRVFEYRSLSEQLVLDKGEVLLCSVDESILRVEVHVVVFENGVTSLVEESSFAFD